MPTPLNPFSVGVSGAPPLAGRTPDTHGAYTHKKYQPQDFASLCALDRLCFPEAIAYTPEEISLAFAQRGAFSWVAEAEDRVVAFVLAYQKKLLIGHIVTLDVHPDFRQRGIGQRLLERAEQRLQERGAERIILEVGVENDVALRFYKKVGYVTKRLLPRYYADRSDAYLMEKTLA